MQGTRHQANIRELEGFHTGGAQCTIMALAALILCSQVVGPSEWCSEIIDYVLWQGDLLYSFIIDTMHGGNHSTHIGHDQLPNSALIYGQSFDVHVLHTLFGMTTMPGDVNIGTVGLQDALSLSLALSGMVLVTIGAESFALIQSGGSLFLFDSHARDRYGNVDGEGTAVLLHFNDQANVSDFLMQRYGVQPFEFSPLHLSASGNSSNSNMLVHESTCDLSLMENNIAQESLVDNTMGCAALSIQPSCSSPFQELYTSGHNHTYSVTSQCHASMDFTRPNFHKLPCGPKPMENDMVQESVVNPTIAFAGSAVEQSVTAESSFGTLPKLDNHTNALEESYDF